jgi:hypothetical protein
MLCEDAGRFRFFRSRSTDFFGSLKPRFISRANNSGKSNSKSEMRGYFPFDKLRVRKDKLFSRRE